MIGIILGGYCMFALPVKLLLKPQFHLLRFKLILAAGLLCSFFTAMVLTQSVDPTKYYIDVFGAYIRISFFAGLALFLTVFALWLFLNPYDSVKEAGADIWKASSERLIRSAKSWGLSLGFVTLMYILALLGVIGH